MQTIFINNTSVILTTQRPKRFPNQDKSILNLSYKTKIDLLDIITYIERNPILKEVYIFGEDSTKLLDDFKVHYQFLTAAGGMVLNKEQKVLMIYRHDRWDLPKGKREKGEDIENTAIREVEEETGIDQLSIDKHLVNTFHTFIKSGYGKRAKRVLKETHWYLMNCKSPNQGIPQTEEGISKVEWVPLDTVKTYMDQTYSSIKSVLNKGLKEM